VLATFCGDYADSQPPTFVMWWQLLCWL